MHTIRVFAIGLLIAVGLIMSFAAEFFAWCASDSGPAILGFALTSLHRAGGLGAGASALPVIVLVMGSIGLGLLASLLLDVVIFAPVVLLEWGMDRRLEKHKGAKQGVGIAKVLDSNSELPDWVREQMKYPPEIRGAADCRSGKGS